MLILKINKKILYLTIFSIIIMVLSLNIMPLENVAILGEIVLTIYLCIVFIYILFKNDDYIVLTDIGLICILFTALYIIVPLINYFIGNFNFRELSDGRLQSLNLQPLELAKFYTYHIIYIVSLGAAYLIFRMPNNLVMSGDFIPPSKSLISLIMCGYLIISLYFSILYFTTNIGFRTGYGDESDILYGPLWLQQINGKLADINFLLLISIIATITFYIKNKIIFISILFIILTKIISNLIYPGSRGELISLLFLVLIFYNLFHGLSVRKMVFQLTIIFILFMFIGAYRSFENFSDMSVAMNQFNVIGSANNEFQSILGTSLHVNEFLKAGIEIPKILFFNDFLPLLPPQQFLPFHKLSGAEWYLIQIDQNNSGAGFMWSVISQSLIGFGYIEIIIRGLLLGWFLAMTHRWYQRRRLKFIPNIIYVFICLNTLWTFRDTTGAILWSIFWAIIPFVVVLYLFGYRSQLSIVSIGKATRNELI